MVHNGSDVMIYNRDCNKMICDLNVQNRAIYTEQKKRKENRKRTELKAIKNILNFSPKEVRESKTPD